MRDTIRPTGTVKWKLISDDGSVKQEGVTHNIVTTEGDNWIADQLSTAAKAVADQMVLGTSATAVDKSDTWTNGPFANSGAEAGTAGSVAVGTVAGTPSAIQYNGTFAAGYATQDGISEVGLANVTPGTSGADPGSGDFIAHALLSPVVNKGANDTLQVDWYLTFTGA